MAKKMTITIIYEKEKDLKESIEMLLEEVTSRGKDTEFYACCRSWEYTAISNQEI